MSRKKRLRRAAHFAKKEALEAAEVDVSPTVNNEIIVPDTVVVEKIIEAVGATEEPVEETVQPPSKGILSNWFKKEASKE